MPSETLAFANITELQVEADEARHLASVLGNAESVADLHAYAASLEADASSCERPFSPSPGPLMIGQRGDVLRSKTYLAGGQH